MWKRIVPILIILVLAVLMAGGIYWGVRKISPGKYTDNLEDWLESRINADVEFGIITPIFYPGLGLQLRDIRFDLLTPDGKPTRDYFHAKRLKVVINPKLLWDEKKLCAREIILDSPSISLHRGPDGKFSLGRLKKNAPETPEVTEDEEEPDADQPEETGIREKAAAWIKEKLEPYIPKTGGAEDVLFNLERIIIHHADFQFKDQKQKKPVLTEPVSLYNMELIIELTN
jgi:uncharacterized protein involved in outer membrane biogenesis